MVRTKGFCRSGIYNLNLQQLEQACAQCQRCDLAKTRTTTVFYRGNPNTKLMVIGEAPGADEDDCGQPFRGRAGKLLDKMFASVNLNTNRDMYISNTLKCRPPENRNPTPIELDACKPYLDQQIKLIQPKVIVAVGNYALNYFIGRTGITRLRGKWFGGPETSKVMAIYHPAYLLRNEYRRAEPDSPHRQAYKDLLAIVDGYSNGNFYDSNP